MSSITISLIVFARVFGDALLGILVRAVLPQTADLYMTVG
jgi:hypothetical protein